MCGLVLRTRSAALIRLRKAGGRFSAIRIRIADRIHRDDRIENGGHRLLTLVAVLAARACTGLLGVLHSQNAKPNGDAALQRDVHQTVCHRIGEVLVVLRLAPDDAAESDNAAIPPGIRRGHGKGGELESPRTLKNRNRPRLVPPRGVFTEGSLQESLGHRPVVPGHNHRNPRRLGQKSFVLFVHCADHRDGPGAGEAGRLSSRSAVWEAVRQGGEPPCHSHERRSGGAVRGGGRGRAVALPSVHMRRILLRIAPVLHLARVTTAFAVVANTWFVILWTRANAQFEGASPHLLGAPLWQLLGAATLVALGLFAFGAALNDILDVRRDRALRPDRPLAAGRISLEAAVALVVGTMLAAVLGATAFGTPAVLLTLAVLAAIFVFNVAGRFVPAFGLVILGLIYSGHMLVPNVQLRFLWPVWLVMTHALAVGAATHIMANKVPRLSRRAILAATLGWLFWSGVILWLQWSRDEAPATGWGGVLPPIASLWPDWVSPAAAVGPAVLAVLFVIGAWDKVRRLGPGPRAAEKISRYGALWLALYACAWLLGDQHTMAAVILGILAICAWIGMTALREVYGLLEQPVGYRR